MNIWAWIVAACVMAVIGVAVNHAFPASAVAPPSAGGINQPTAFAQAINVVEVHAGQPTTREFIVQSKQALAENHRRIHGVPTDAR